MQNHRYARFACHERVTSIQRFWDLIMKSNFRGAVSLAAVFIAAAALTGCTAMQEKHRQHHPAVSATGSPGSMGRGGSAGQMGMMDAKSMCEMHDRMMSAKTPAERTAMMDERMKNSSPEERQRHMEMMKQQCK